MIGKFDNIKIQGMCTAVPECVEENKNFESILGPRRTKKQIRLTGVSKRHIAERKQRTSDLCYAATLPLLEKLKWDRNEIKVLIYITQGPNYKLPSTAFFLQHRLGIPKDCVCFDINLGCSSFNAGVHVVSALLQSCNVNDKALLLIGDTASQVLSPEASMDEDAIADRMIFGAAGAAIALEKVKNSELMFMTKSDGDGFEAIIRHFGKGTTMNGAAVFEFAINDVSDDVNVFKNHFGLKEEDIDYYVFHQAQKLVLDNIAASCELPDGKELRSLDEYGNTSGTSVPVTVCANWDKFADRKSVNLFLCGFGVGLSWGAIFAEIPTENILPVIETSEHYDEDKVPNGVLAENNILVVGADRPLGESISRYLNNNTANVILAGQNVNKLRDIQKDLLFKTHIIEYTDLDFSLYESVAQYCEKEDVRLNGLVFTDEDIKPDIISGIGQKLFDKGCTINNIGGTSIVLVSNIETFRLKDTQMYQEKKEKMNDILSQIQEDVGTDEIRVNAVTYDEAAFDFTQVAGNGQEWIEKYLKENCPKEMKRPLILGKAMVYLLSGGSAFTTGTMISINR